MYGGHGWHAPLKLPAGLKVPSGHTMGVEFVEHACPGGHMHDDSEALPRYENGSVAGHAVHASPPVDAYVPEGQGLHSLAPAGLTCPTRHSTCIENNRIACK